MLRLVVILAYVAITVYAVADAAQHPSPKPFGLRKWLWIAAILLLPAVGALAWLIIKFVSGGEGKGPRGRPMAPDDDPDYLRWLEQQRRRRST
jgi:hypothetical protein